MCAVTKGSVAKRVNWRGAFIYVMNVMRTLHPFILKKNKGSWLSVNKEESKMKRITKDYCPFCREPISYIEDGSLHPPECERCGRNPWCACGRRYPDVY